MALTGVIGPPGYVRFSTILPVLITTPLNAAAPAAQLVDVDLVSKLARGTSWVNLFSPQNRDYSIKLVPVSPDREPPADSKTEVATPPGTEVLLSWFGAPEAGLQCRLVLPPRRR